MNRSSIRRLALGALLISSVPAGAADGVLATVNGTAIKESDYQAYLREHKVSEQAALDKQRVLDELISRELVYQDARKKKLDKDPQVLKQFEMLRRNLLLNAAIREHIAKQPVTDEELRREYDAQTAKFSQKEYHASHILLKSEEEAKKIIAALDEGAQFAALAKKHSVGPTGPKGGDLGWFAPQQMVPPFAAAVTTLAKGTYSRAPVQTQFGWHVILLQDTRDMEAPPFDSVKDRMRTVLEQQRVTAYIAQLKKGADVQVK